MSMSRGTQTKTVKVIVRHAADCKYQEQGSEWHKCECRKSLRVCEGDTQKTSITSARSCIYKTTGAAHLPLVRELQISQIS
jgi:hypothetical protein